MSPTSAAAVNADGTTKSLHVALQSLEDQLTPRGFVRSSSFGKTSWAGRVANEDDKQRACLISVVPQGRTTYAGEVKIRRRLGYRLRVEMESTAKARVFFVRDAIASSAFIRWVYRLRRQSILDEVPRELDGFAVVTKDRQWAEQLVEDRGAMTATASLLQEHAAPQLAGSVYLSPSLVDSDQSNGADSDKTPTVPSRSRGTIYYASPILQLEHLSPHMVDRVIDRMQTLANAAERLPPSTIATEVTAVEAFAQRNPVIAGAAIVGGGLLLCLGFVGVLLGGAMLLLGA